PGSSCGTCGTPLAWWENIPILSYFMLRGKCHTCGSTFSCRYAGVEFMSGCMAVALLRLCGGVTWHYIYMYVFYAYLCAVFFMDFDNWIILDSVSLSGTLVGLIGSLFTVQRLDIDYFSVVWLNNLLSSLLGAAIGALLFWAIQFLGSIIMRQEALGSGDIKLAALIGAFLGWQYGLLALMLSFVLGAVTVPLLMLLRRQSMGGPLPLGTFMAIASMLVVFYGDRLMHILLYWPLYFGLFP
ncbi:prepilin peptidase, partial [bacterium]|nr:prepilin peptidase [bacterium]